MGDIYGKFEDMLSRPAIISMSKDVALRNWKTSSRRPRLAKQLLRLARRRDVLSEILNTIEGNFAFQLSRRVLPSKIRKAILTRLPSPNSTTDSRDRHIYPLNPYAVRFLCHFPEGAIDKERELLGCKPASSLDRGMHLTRVWAEWAGLLPAGQTSSKTTR